MSINSSSHRTGPGGRQCSMSMSTRYTGSICEYENEKEDRQCSMSMSTRYIGSTCEYENEKGSE